MSFKEDKQRMLDTNTNHSINVNTNKLTFKEVIILLLMYTMLYVYYFNIQFKNFSTALLFDGRYYDILQVYWNTWHFSFSLKSFTNPFITNYQLFPIENSLWMHAYTPFFGVINLFVNNPVLAINLGLFLTFTLGSVFAYKLMGLFINNKVYRFIASTFYLFNLYTINKIGIHYNLVLIVVSPLLIYTLIKAISVNADKIYFHKKYVVQSALLILVNFLFDYYALFYALSFIILYVFYFKYFKTWINNFTWKKSLFLVVFFLLMHIIIRLLRISGVAEKGALWSAADVRSYVLSSTSLYPDWLRLNVDLISEHSLFVGYVLLMSLVIILFIKKKDNYTGFLLFSLIVYAIVSAPVFRINNKDLFYFPNGIIHFIPFVNNVRNPSRFLEMIFLLMSILIFRKVELMKPKLEYLWISGIFILSSIEQNAYAKEYLKVKKIDVKNIDKYNSIYTVKNKLPVSAAILPIPFGVRDGFEQFGEFDETVYIEQSIHNLKVSSGYYSRISKGIWDKYKNNEFYKRLVEAQKDSLVTLLTEKQLNDFIEESKLNAVFINTEYVRNKPNLYFFIAKTFPQEKYKWEELDDRIIIYLK